LQALAVKKVWFLLVGAWDLVAYGYPRAIMDVDIWELLAQENADAVWRALRRFGAVETLEELANSEHEAPGDLR